MIGAGQGAVAVLGGGGELAVSVHDGGQHGQRLAGLGGRGGRGGRAGSFGRDLVVAVQLGSRTRARRRISQLRGHGEHVRHVGGGAAGQGDIGVLAVLGAADHGQAGGHGAALRDVVGDRVAQLGVLVAGVQETAVGPAALAGGRVGVQGAADEQAVAGDRLDAEQVAVGQRAAGLARLDTVVVAGADDQVAGAGGGAVGDGHGGAVLDDAEADQVVADAAGQFPAQRVVGGHQQDIGALGGQRQVGGRGGIGHLLRLAAEDPGVLVVLGEHRRVAVAQPQAGLLLPSGAEPGRLGQAGVAEGVGEQGHAAAVLDRLQLLGIAGQDHLGAAGGGLGDDVGQVGGGGHGGLVHQDQVAGPQADGAAGAAPAGQVAQELGGVVALGDSRGQGVAGRLGRGDADHPAEPGRGPRLACRGQHPGFAGPGGRVDHRDAPAVGQDR